MASYNSSKHSSLGFSSPRSLFFGRPEMEYGNPEIVEERDWEEELEQMYTALEGERYG